MSRIPYSKNLIPDGSINNDMSEKISNLPFAELRKVILTEIVPNLTRTVENSQISATLAQTSVSANDVFDKMFHGPLCNWRIPDETLESARQKYLPLIELAMEDKTKTPYQRVGDIKDLFVEFRKEMPKRIHSRMSKRGLPYGTRHEVLRESMDCLLEGLSMREMPMHDNALFPEGNPWSSTFSKILKNMPPHSKYKDLPSPVTFLFKLGRGRREYDRKELKSEIMASLNSVEHMVISPRFGRLNEPRINPWLWHNTQNLDDQFSVRPGKFTILKDKHNPGDDGRHRVESLISLIEDEQKMQVKGLRSLMHLQYHLLTADKATVNRQYIRGILKEWGGWNRPVEFDEAPSEENKIDKKFEKEINDLGIEHIKANPWCILDMPAEIPPVWLKTALERQPLLMLLESFTSLHTSWKEKLESIHPGVIEHVKTSLISICYALGHDIKDDGAREIFRNEIIRYFKEGGLNINEASVNLDSLDVLV